MKTVIFDIETYAFTSELYHDDMSYLKQRGTNKTEEMVLEGLSFNPYLSNVVSVAAIELDESDFLPRTESNEIDIESTVGQIKNGSIPSLKARVWYLTENEDETNTIEHELYMKTSHEIEFIPIRIDEYETEEIKKKERELLKQFFSATSNADRVISYNGKKFDNVFLFIRGIYHDLDLPYWLMDRRPYESKHFDIMDFLSRGQGESKYSLHFVSKHMGFKTPKIKYEGSMVRDLFKEGKYKEIARYCALDTIVLTYMYHKFRKYLPKPQTLEKLMITEKQIEFCTSMAKTLLNLKNSDDEIKPLFSSLDKDMASIIIELLKELVKIQNKKQNTGQNGTQSGGTQNQNRSQGRQ